MIEGVNRGCSLNQPKRTGSGGVTAAIRVHDGRKFNNKRDNRPPGKKCLGVVTTLQSCTIPVDGGGRNWR